MIGSNLETIPFMMIGKKKRRKECLRKIGSVHILTDFSISLGIKGRKLFQQQILIYGSMDWRKCGWHL